MFGLFKKNSCGCSQKNDEIIEEKRGLLPKKEENTSHKAIDIKILGGNGCSSCEILYANTLKVVKDLSLDLEVKYIKDLDILMKYEIMSIPALVINEDILSVGKVLKPSEIEEYIKKYL